MDEAVLQALRAEGERIGAMGPLRFRAHIVGIRAKHILWGLQWTCRDLLRVAKRLRCVARGHHDLEYAERSDIGIRVQWCASCSHRTDWLFNVRSDEANTSD